MSFFRKHRLRALALRQLIRYDLREREHHFVEKMLFSAQRAFTVLTGHLAPEFSVAADPETIGFVEHEADLTDGLIDEAFRSGVEYFLRIGPAASNFDPAFLGAQLAHYASCAECRDHMQRKVREDWRNMRFAKDVVGRAYGATDDGDGRGGDAAVSAPPHTLH